MTVLLPLSETPDSRGYVDYLINVDRRTFIRLDGANTEECIGIIHGFLCKYGVCSRTDRLMHELQPEEYAGKRPIASDRYHNISFVANFYRLAYRSQQRYLQVTREAASQSNVPSHLSREANDVYQTFTPELLQATRMSLRSLGGDLAGMAFRNLDDLVSQLQYDDETDYYRPDQTTLDLESKVVELFSDQTGHLTEEMSSNQVGDDAVLVEEMSHSATESEHDLDDPSSDAQAIELSESDQEQSQASDGSEEQSDPEQSEEQPDPNKSEDQPDPDESEEQSQLSEVSEVSEPSVEQSEEVVPSEWSDSEESAEVVIPSKNSKSIVSTSGKKAPVRGKLAASKAPASSTKKTPALKPVPKKTAPPKPVPKKAAPSKPAAKKAPAPKKAAKKSNK